MGNFQTDWLVVPEMFNISYSPDRKLSHRRTRSAGNLPDCMHPSHLKISFHVNVASYVLEKQYTLLR